MKSISTSILTRDHSYCFVPKLRHVATAPPIIGGSSAAVTMAFVEGRMFNFSPDKKSLVTFISVSSSTHQLCSNALILIPGLTEGFMSMSYTAHLASKLEQEDFSLVQAQLSSSFMQFGFSSVAKDSEELTPLVAFLKDQLKFKRVVILGHSTGAQDAVYFISHSPERGRVDAVILQGAVSDRDIIEADPAQRAILDEAKKLRDEGKEEAFLTEYVYDAPVTAKRFLSLGERLSDEDMFSMDLTRKELVPIFKEIRVPVFLAFGSEDETVPDHDAQRKFADKMVEVLKTSSSRVECKYYEGDHGLTMESAHKPFVEDIVTFLKNAI